MVSFRLGIDEVQLHDDINTLGHPARRAYYMGLDETDKELRQQQLDLMRAAARRPLPTVSNASNAS